MYMPSCSIFFFSSRRRHTRSTRDWSSDVCSSDLEHAVVEPRIRQQDKAARQEPGVADHDGPGVPGQWLAAVKAYGELTAPPGQAREPGHCVGQPPEPLLEDPGRGAGDCGI